MKEVEVPVHVVEFHEGRTSEKDETLKVNVVKDGDCACPECGAFWGHPDPELDYPNRFKVDDYCKCYNPNCRVAYYNPFTHDIEY